MTNSVAVKFSGAPVILEMECKGLVGGRSLTLTDDSGLMKLTFPAQLWQFIQPGDHIHMTFSPVKVTVMPIEPELPGLPRGLQ